MITNLIFVLVSAFTAADAPVFEAQMVDASSVVGILVELTPERAILDTPQGKVDLELAKLLYLHPKDVMESATTFAPPMVWLEFMDGSRIAALQYIVEADKAKCTLTNGAILVVSVNAIRNVRLQAETPKIASEWSRILGMKAEGDILVVRNGESVDYHQGVLHEVSEDAVKFELDSDTLPIKRAKIFGFAYRHTASEEKSPPVGYIFDRGGSRWAVASFNLGEKLEWTTPGGVNYESPLADIKSIDFSLGKVQYLSDLKPESVVWTPFFGQGQVSPTLERFYAPRMDRNFDSNPLQLKKTIYPKGLALHSRTEIVYRLPDVYGRFRAVAGIDDTVTPKGNVRLLIRGDDKLLFESAINGSEPPHKIDLDISGVRRITILVDYGDTFGAGDHLILGNARIYK
jgi:hypothetical protein